MKSPRTKKIAGFVLEFVAHGLNDKGEKDNEPYPVGTAKAGTIEQREEAKNAPPKVTSVVKVNSHLRPVELMSSRRSSSFFPSWNIIEFAP